MLETHRIPSPLWPLILVQISFPPPDVEELFYQSGGKKQVTLYYKHIWLKLIKVIKHWFGLTPIVRTLTLKTRSCRCSSRFLLRSKWAAAMRSDISSTRCIAQRTLHSALTNFKDVLTSLLLTFFLYSFLYWSRSKPSPRKLQTANTHRC